MKANPNPTRHVQSAPNGWKDPGEVHASAESMRDYVRDLMREASEKGIPVSRALVFFLVSER